MTFPFGIFKKKKPMKGWYSGAMRNPEAEESYDEGDNDQPYGDHLNMNEDPKKREEFEVCWQDRISRERDLYDTIGLEFYAIAQSHMDIAWLWRMYQIINKARITHGKAAFHVLNIPDFKFTFSQPIILDWLERVFPETFAEVKQAVETGRFALEGGDWVESDAKVPSGESFCRQRLYGQRYYLEKFGKMAKVGWLPDSFGYNNNIPQFLQKSGCKYFYTQKISGNFPPDAFPFIHFKWRSPSGYEVITYSNNFQFRPVTRWHIFGQYRRLLKPGTTVVCDYSHPDPASDKNLDDPWPVIGIMFGQGDGGHGPTCEEVHRMRYFIENGHVKEFKTALEYFEMYEEIKDRLPVWNGAELFYNLHRGTLTTQGLVKRMNRFFEWRLNGCQSILALRTFLAGLEGKEFHDVATRLWKDTLLLQFHDILPGSSIPEVYDDCYDMWIDNIKDLNALFDVILGGEWKHVDFLLETCKHVAICNPSSFSGIAPVEIPVSETSNSLSSVEFNQIDADGKALNGCVACQLLPAEDLGTPFISRPSRILTCIKASPWTVSTCTLEKRDASKEQQATTKVLVEGRVCKIDSVHSTITIDADSGEITGYHDKRIGKNVLIGSAGLKCYRDWFVTERAWNIGPGYKECPFDDDEVECRGIKIIENGPVRYAVEIGHVLLESNTKFKTRIQVYDYIPGLHVEMVIDWNQEETIVKYQIPCASSPAHVIAEGPYTTEVITAQIEKRSHLEQQRWEACWHTWLACPAPDDSWGVALINDCKYGMDVDGNAVSITIIRGPDYPPASGYAREERARRKDGGPPTHTDKGKHLVRFAILPYNGSWSRGLIQKAAHQFNAPVLGRIIDNPSMVNVIEPGISISSDNLELTAIKLPENNPSTHSEIILRIVETGRLITKGKIALDPNLRVRTAVLVDLIERDTDGSAMLVEKAGDIITSIELAWQPHEIHTIKLCK